MGVISFGALAETKQNDADQKWLQIVEQKITSGQTEVSTPSKERSDLLKEWAGTKGYTVAVTKTGENFRIALTKSSKEVAQR